jgi:phage baseplate assembly protein W
MRTTQPIAQGMNGGGGSYSKPQITGRKFTLYDENLVVQDLINALNIRQGTKPGNPGYGTTLWGFVFEQNDDTTQGQLSDEIRRVGGLDPRLVLNNIDITPLANGLLVQVEFAVTPFNNVQTLELMFDQASGTVSSQ